MDSNVQLTWHDITQNCCMKKIIWQIFHNILVPLCQSFLAKIKTNKQTNRVVYKTFIIWNCCQKSWKSKTNLSSWNEEAINRLWVSSSFKCLFTLFIRFPQTPKYIIYTAPTIFLDLFKFLFPLYHWLPSSQLDPEYLLSPPQSLSFSFALYRLWDIFGQMDTEMTVHLCQSAFVYKQTVKRHFSFGWAD